MRMFMISAALLFAGLSTACGRDDKSSKSSGGLAVSVTPTGRADVALTDEKGKPVDTSGATGRVEFSDGRSVPLTPSEGGRMSAPLGEHMRSHQDDCDATVRVTPRGGRERVARLDVCGTSGSMPGGMHGEHE